MRHFVRHFPAVAGVRWGVAGWRSDGVGMVDRGHVAAVALADALEAELVERVAGAPRCPMCGLPLLPGQDVTSDYDDALVHFACGPDARGRAPRDHDGQPGTAAGAGRDGYAASGGGDRPPAREGSSPSGSIAPEGVAPTDRRWGVA